MALATVQATVQAIIQGPVQDLAPVPGTIMAVPDRAPMPG